MTTSVEFEGLHNVRDLGGMRTHDGRTVRSGLLLRGDQPFEATEGDKRKIAELGVRTLIDFRSLAEHEKKPDPAIPGVSNVHLPIIKDVRAGITHGEESDKALMRMFSEGHDVAPEVVDKHMGNMYRLFVEDDFANAQYARFVDLVLEQALAGGATLWHCTAGKDRAGFATVILLEALGVPRADIVADYMRTNESLAHVVEKLVTMFSSMLPSENARQSLRRFFLADERYLAAAYDAADERYGSFDAFLAEALHVDDAKRAKLQELLLA